MVHKAQSQSVKSDRHGTGLTHSRLIEAAPVGENLCTNGTQGPEPKCQVRPAWDWLDPFTVD
ncbi:hypothetical protein [Kamptonema formosum]|uniref:hypothetical protein n=1 Tax=Kamptonema formosum TaxID=331992 RepID=UPI001E38BF96|nr:hypothetical protein [Oscillatoria sp. PCC 10802]